jgi:uncharacterized protein YbaR (Trm112 family)
MPVLDDAMLARLRCPVTGSVLAVAEPALLARLNEQITAKQALTRLSDVVSIPVTDGLVNADRTLLYPIVAGIVTLLASEAIEIWELRDSD